MTITITDNEFKQLREYIEKECGILVGDDKVYLIEKRLLKLVIENGCETFGEFYDQVVSSPDRNLRTKIIDAITTNETLWFRDKGPFSIFRDKLLPEFCTDLLDDKKEKIRIWSAACSSGQEPYSLAMVLDDYVKQNPTRSWFKGKVEFLATDISPSVLFLAKLGRYDAIAMSRGMEDAYRQAYFEEQNRAFVLKEEIRKMIAFQQFNLQEPFEPLGRFDLILLRNVAIYFSMEFKIRLFQKVADALNPGGYLILGASESLSNYSNQFEIIEHEHGIIYRLKPEERCSL